MELRNAEKLAAAIAWLGVRWVLHPAYVLNPKHKLAPEQFPKRN